MQCKVCGRDCVPEKIPKFRLVSDENQVYRWAIHQSCWDLFIQDEARNILLRQHLKEIQITPTQEQLDSIEKKEELVDCILAGKVIEWKFKITYEATRYEEESEKAVAFVNANKGELFALTTSKVEWIPKWQVML